MKKEQLSNSESPKIKYALADKYEKEDKAKEDKEQKTYDRLKAKESELSQQARLRDNTYGTFRTFHYYINERTSFRLLFRIQGLS